MILLFVLSLLFIMNATAFLAFAIDKGRAERGEWRIAESTLLTIALFGGSAGACWARARFRHKTRKQPFATQLDVIAMLHAGLAIGLIATFAF